MLDVVELLPHHNILVRVDIVVANECSCQKQQSDMFHSCTQH